MHFQAKSTLKSNLYHTSKHHNLNNLTVRIICFLQSDHQGFIRLHLYLEI